MRWPFVLFRYTINALGLDTELLVEPFFTLAHVTQWSDAILDSSSARDLVNHGADLRIYIGNVGHVGFEVLGIGASFRIVHLRNFQTDKNGM